MSVAAQQPTGSAATRGRRRRRRWAIRVGAAVSVGLVIAFPLSFGWHVGWAFSTGDFVQLDEGHVVVGRTYCAPGMTLTGPTPITLKSFVRDFRSNQGFSYSTPSADGRWHLQLPLWSLLLAIGVPTILLWKRPRLFRRRPGHCVSCGYDLSGNISGVCPECGRATSKPGSRP